MSHQSQFLSLGVPYVRLTRTQLKEETLMKAIVTAVADHRLGLFAVFAPGASAATVALGGRGNTRDGDGTARRARPVGCAFRHGDCRQSVDGRPVFTFPITGGTLDTQRARR